MKTRNIIILIIVIILIVAGIGIWLSSSNESNKANINNNLNSSANINENDNQNDESITNTVNNNNIEDQETSSRSKIAIIYFSATGNTERVAGYIKEVTDGDLIEIEPKDKYTDSDLNYNNGDSRTTKEQNDSSARPEIANSIDTDSYDVIYLGYPIWWGDAPKIILTFLDNYDLSGKTVIPFCTSGSSEISTSVNYLKNNYKNINWLEGKRLSISQSEVTEWVNSLNY